ncbi:synaptic vesicle glycoprotein 2B-like isoform X2 [Phymastichus coffea]|nr:synaptic vesicle glycoprotein 2B-like isoform X2 [Phymastichus coffea]XP_058794901.1 synaptic vesicle glycoprotein 2B-like isoform X2 [Phymastichus coffea]XP_058794902.1 synaptic vesicle glycoprotein 2B-like isoform X2 [Phymastichus coffea]XP_058794903.1 synaptic vesicle glycoprotein 2B-like isoform X2 [Phymastichus coffea]
MVVGTGIWGYLANIKGRRTSLLLTTSLQFIADALCSIVPNYWIFVFLKFLSGIGVCGQLSIVFPYLGEFQPTRYRHRILSGMEGSWAIGVIAVALFAWAVIPIPYAYKTSSFFFSSWNLFVLASAMPALITFLWLLTLPETPKFLAETGQREILLKVLTRMFVENTGECAEKFKEILARSDCPTISSLISQTESINLDKCSDKRPTKLEKLKEMINNSKTQVKTLLEKPYGKRLFVTGSVMFCMTSTYYSLMTWFPELFQRFAAFESRYPGEFASVCTISGKLIATNESVDVNETNPYGCNVPMDTSVYVNSIWLGVACLPGAVLLPLTVDHLGYRVYMLFTATISCAVTIAFFFVKTSTQNLILSCIFEAFTSLNISVTFCLLVELFPTNLRVMATAITLFIGRCGSLFGNMLFGYLIDKYCMELIIVMGAELFLAAGMCWATPGRDKMRKLAGFTIKNKASSPS